MNNFQKHLDCRMVRNVFVMFILLFSFLLPTVSYADEESELNTQEIDIQSYVNDMQPGWNLGNTFDAVGTDETAWGNPRVTKDLIDHIADQGFKSIRIPITFDQRMSGAPDYTVDADFLERVEQAVQWSLDADMYVMINIHHDSWVWIADGMGNNHDETVARFNAIWEQLADKFKAYPVELMFESINEPQFWVDEDEQLEYLAELNDSFFRIVREAGGKNGIRPLVLPTLNTGSEPEKLAALYEEINALNDPNLISTVHFYGFWPFSVNIAGHTTFDEGTKQDIIDTFDRVYDQFVANGIPVIIGEFGLLGFDQDINAIQQGEKLKFFEYMIHYAQEKELTHMLWDNGQHFGRQSFEWSDQQLFNMMQDSWTTRSATAESDFIYLKKGKEIQDTELKLHLHGNEFVTLRINDQILEEGKDYVLNGEQLIVKADLLSELISSGELGVNAVLTADFDKGVNWDFNVITYEEATLQSTEGTTDNFKIPTLFNGDDLATLEAYYEDGSIAGPQDWTPFKEFAYTFSPLYDSNEIILKENFFNEVNDGNVYLIFHFWSGETYSYTLIKEGNNVIGIGEDLPDLDLTRLIDLIEQAETFLNEENKYTESTFDALKDALAKANASLSDFHSETDLEKTLQDLQAAIDGLKEKSTKSKDENSLVDQVINKPENSKKPKPVGDDSDTGNNGGTGSLVIENGIDPLSQMDDRQKNDERSLVKKIDKSGKELPKTATSMYLLLIVGFSLLSIATILLIIYRRNKATDIQLKS